MCKFISLISNGDGTPVFFTEEIRSALLVSNPENYQMDSHTSIAAFFKLNDDKVNKYEYDPFLNTFAIDCLNAHDDSEHISNFCKSHDWQSLILQQIYDLQITEKHENIDFSFLTELKGNVSVRGTFTAPALTTANNVFVRGTFTAPALTTANDVDVVITALTILS